MANKKSNKNDIAYDIGFGKPPKETQFKPGQSGNPNGRPKGRKNVATVLQAVLDEKVAITESGKRKEITKLEAAMKQVVNKAASGDLKSTKVLVQLLPCLESELADKPQQPSREGDLQVLKNLINRIQPHNPAPLSDPTSDDKGTSK